MMMQINTTVPLAEIPIKSKEMKLIIILQLKYFRDSAALSGEKTQSLESYQCLSQMTMKNKLIFKNSMTKY